MELLEELTYPEQLICAKATVQKIPVNGILELTPLCNMNCDMCYVRLSHEEMERQGRLRTVDEWLMLAGQMQKAGVIFLLLTGGEPLLYPGFRQLYLELKKMGMILTINTNGTLLDEDWAEFFYRYPPRRINMTLYGADERAYEKLCHYPDGFNKALHAVRLLQERKVSVKINGSLTAVNPADGLAIARLSGRMNAVCKIDTYMYPVSRERSQGFEEQSRLTPQEAAKARVELMKEQLSSEAFGQLARHMVDTVRATEVAEAVSGTVSCRAGRSSFMINWQGEMRPCVMLNTPSVSVFENGFDNAWQYIIEETEKIRLYAGCSACAMREICQTCAACAYAESGSYDGKPAYMCEYTKETLRLLSLEAMREEL